MFFSTKLEKKLTVSIIVSLIISVAIGFIVNFLGENIIYQYYDESALLKKKGIQALSDFRSYVYNNKISINDETEIDNWIRDNKYVDIYIFQNNNLVYSSNNIYPTMAMKI